MIYTAPKRFTKSLAEWCRADTDLVTLTAHAADNLRIKVFTGDNKLDVNSLIIDVVSMDPWHPDLDHIFVSRVFFIAYALTRLIALDIMGATVKLLSQSTSDQSDASFTLNSIRTKGIQIDTVDPFGEAALEATSIRRTERSDIVVPGRHVAIVSASIRWEDTTA